MTKHLILLRGVNVSGHNMIKMAELTEFLGSKNFTEVSTYIQSGNVFVTSSEENGTKVAFEIKQLLFNHFGLDVAVLAVSKNQLEHCISNNIFLKEKGIDPKKLYVAFTSKELNQNHIHELKPSQFKPDEVYMYSTMIYIKYADSASKTKLDNKYIEKKLGLISTIRNWNTVSKLVELFKD